MRRPLRGTTLMSALLLVVGGFHQPLDGSVVRRSRPSTLSSPAVARSSVLRLDTDEDATEEVDADLIDADLNWLHTRLQVALEREDYTEALNLRDRIRRCADLNNGAGIATEAAWTNLGVPDWLADRLERLSLPLPTRVQLHALRAAERGDDAAICAPTGSGKTLSYVLPLLTQLSEDLLSEDLSNYLANFLDGGRQAANVKGTQRRRAAAQNVADGVTDTAVPTPAVLIVVPTREVSRHASECLGAASECLSECHGVPRSALMEGLPLIDHVRSSVCKCRCCAIACSVEAPRTRRSSRTRTHHATRPGARRTCSRTRDHVTLR